MIKGKRASNSSLVECSLELYATKESGFRIESIAVQKLITFLGNTYMDILHIACY